MAHPHPVMNATRTPGSRLSYRDRFPVARFSDSTRSALQNRFLFALPQPVLALGKFENQKVVGETRGQRLSWRKTTKRCSHQHTKTIAINWQLERKKAPPPRLAARSESEVTSGVVTHIFLKSPLSAMRKNPSFWPKPDWTAPLQVFVSN